MSENPAGATPALKAIMLLVGPAGPSRRSKINHLGLSETVEFLDVYQCLSQRDRLTARSPRRADASPSRQPAAERQRIGVAVRELAAVLGGSPIALRRARARP